MVRFRTCRLVALLGCFALVTAHIASAQQPPRVAAAPNNSAGPYRALAPGVEITIPPDRQERETYSRHDVVEVLQGIPGLDWTPKFGATTQTLKSMATDATFRRDIWSLEFTFKPVRMIWVDVPQANGAAKRKLIWYMVYHVRNTGGHLHPVPQQDGKHEFEPVDRDIRFFPTFKLESREYGKVYVDTVIPAAIQAIQQKEDPQRTLHDSVTVGSKLIGVSTDLIDRSVWGVATWEDVDSRIDYFSVYVQGLTNAYEWVDAPGAFKRGDPPTKGRRLLQKALQLNFWRPGDEYVEDRRTIRYGIPGEVDYRWVYR